MEIITRKQALEQGLKRYFTGKPCKYGHVAERSASSWDCCECKRLHREENKEKVSAWNNKWKQENKKKVMEYTEKYYKENKERRKSEARGWQQENKEKVKITKRQYYEENKEKLMISAKRYRKENPMPFFIRSTLKRIETGENNTSKRTMAEIEQVIGYTQECFKGYIESLWLNGMSWGNRKDWHIDHTIPINQFIKNGIEDIKIINHLDNLQPLWAKENLSKSGAPVPQAEFDEFIKQHS